MHKIDPRSIHPTAIIDNNVTIGKNSKIWQWVHISSGANIGSIVLLVKMYLFLIRFQLGIM